jgi:hypothetical protein
MTDQSTITVTILTNETLSLDDLKARADEVQLPYREADDGSGIVLQCADEETASFWRDRGALWGTPEADDEANTVLPGDSDA